jgi:effector-binding domain-containing protein
MIETPHIVEFAGFDLAAIRIQVPPTDMQKAMGPAVQEVMSALTAQGIKPAGPLCDHYFRLDSTVLDFEVGVPIDRVFVPTARVVRSQLPPRTVARTTYQGPYQRLQDAWAEFTHWLNANNHHVESDFWQCYVCGPESTSDAMQWTTELNRPLRR